MDILLTQSYLIERDPPEKRIMRPYPPLGIMYLAAFLKEEGFNISLLDNTFEINLDKFKSTVREEKPKLVGISSVEICRGTALEMCRIAKESGCKVVMGGCDPVNCRDACFDSGADWVCDGEGENTLSQLASLVCTKQKLDINEIPGLYYRNGETESFTGNRKHVDDLDSLPMPDWRLVPVEKYLNAWQKAHGETALAMISSRGCPHGCAWCSRNVFGKTYRRRGVENFVDEIQLLKNKFNPDYLWFADDSFTSSLEWLENFQQELNARNLKIAYECLGRVDEISDHKAEILEKTGCRLIWFGVESGSQRILDAMNKGFQLDDVHQTREIMRDANIPTGFFIMLGYPPEDKNDVLATANLVMETKPERVGVSVAYPIAGTQFYNQVIGDGVDGAWKVTGENRPIFKTRYAPVFYRFARRLILKQAQLGSRQSKPSFLDRIKLTIYSTGLKITSIVGDGK